MRLQKSKELEAVLDGGRKTGAGDMAPFLSLSDSI